MAEAHKAINDSIRRRAILSQLDDTALAAVAGCGREHMNKFRNGRCDMSLPILCTLAEHFGGEVVVNWSQGGGLGR